MKFNKSVTVVLGVLGLLGAFSIALMEPPLPKGITLPISDLALRLLMVINPLIYLVIALGVGGLLAHRVGLRAPLIECLLKKNKIGGIFADQAKWGIPAGFVLGAIVTFVLNQMMPLFPLEYREASQSAPLHPLTRFLYGGILEEIMLRWGMMTFLVWLPFQLLKKGEGKPPAGYFHLAIFLSAILFAVGHLPMLFAYQIPFTPILVVSILIGNSLFGILTGYLYWKKGLESAMLAHIFGHVGMMSVEALL